MDEGRFLISADHLCQRLGSAAVLLDGKVRFSTTDKIFADPDNGRALDHGGQRDPFRGDRDHPTALTNFPATRMETGDDDQP
jgi:hypothetical protein